MTKRNIIYHCVYRFFVIALLSLTAFSAQASVEHYFQKLSANPLALYDFLKRMPKGGELHYHFDGAVDAETMLYLAKYTQVCLDPMSYATEFCRLEGTHFTVPEVLKHPKLFNQTIRTWSMKDFRGSIKEAYAHFHSVFPKLFVMQSQLQTPFLAAILKKAAEQREDYLELIAFGLNEPEIFVKDIERIQTWKEKRARLLNSAQFRQAVAGIVKQSQVLYPSVRHLLHCQEDPKQAVCRIQLNYQYYARRSLPLNAFFIDILAGFEAAQRSETIVAVNLVGAEDDPIAQRDFQQQMQIFQYLHQQYPGVSIALHAGELFPRSARSVLSPIRDSIRVGYAQRIGHGLDIFEEPHADELAQEMADKQIAVEVNLTSNRLIIGVSGQQHPLKYYLAHHVPVVLSTDDAGILRTDLTREYWDAALHYQVDYATLKQINRNTLTYAFLPGKSLWQDPEKAKVVRECVSLDSLVCQQFIQHNPKAKLQWQLEKELNAFEEAY